LVVFLFNSLYEIDPVVTPLKVFLREEREIGPDPKLVVVDDVNAMLLIL
jgi:hypothetical protein